jgi:hypothetical protein
MSAIGGKEGDLWPPVGGAIAKGAGVVLKSQERAGPGVV